MIESPMDNVPTDIDGIMVGRDVHYFLRPDDPTANHNDGQKRAAKIVRVFPGFENTGYTVNLCVFLDGANDTDRPESRVIVEQADQQLAEVGRLMWVTSVKYDRGGAPGTWRWMRD